jgi:hypothetical protein
MSTTLYYGISVNQDDLKQYLPHDNPEYTELYGDEGNDPDRFDDPHQAEDIFVNSLDYKETNIKTISTDFEWNSKNKTKYWKTIDFGEDDYVIIIGYPLITFNYHYSAGFKIPTISDEIKAEWEKFVQLNPVIANVVPNICVYGSTNK